MELCYVACSVMVGAVAQGDGMSCTKVSYSLEEGCSCIAGKNSVIIGLNILYC